MATPWQEGRTEGREGTTKATLFLLTEEEENINCQLRDSQQQIQTLAGPDGAGDTDTLVTCHRDKERW